MNRNGILKKMEKKYNSLLKMEYLLDELYS